MLRNVVGAIAGIAVAVLTVMLFEWISHTIYPMPPGLEITDTEALNAFLAAAPITALLLVIAGSVLGTFDGVLVACLIGRTHTSYLALLIGVLMLAGTATNLIMYRHPTWFSVTIVAGIIAAAWVAMKFATAIRAKRAGVE